MARKLKHFLLDAGVFLLGSGVYALSVNVFTAPNEIAPGGLTGVGTIVHYLWGVPIGTVILLCNLPLFLWGGRQLGWKFIARTIAATVLVSVFIDVGALFLPAYHGDKMLAALYGGLLSGSALGLLFLRNATTGGTDLAAKLISRRMPNISLGRLILALDFLVILLAVLVYRNMETALYALIAIFTSTRVIDTIVYGINRGKLLFIISRNPEEIAQKIGRDAHRGATILSSKGAYHQQQNAVVLCAVRRSEVFTVLRAAKSIDPGAFIIAGEVGDILGEGFTPIPE